jgi:hypothetical protein
MQHIEDPGLDNCHKYMERYHKCVAEAANAPGKLKECRKILKYYEYCLIREDVRQKEERIAGK